MLMSSSTCPTNQVMEHTSRNNYSWIETQKGHPCGLFSRLNIPSSSDDKLMEQFNIGQNSQHASPADHLNEFQYFSEFQNPLKTVQLSQRFANQKSIVTDPMESFPASSFRIPTSGFSYAGNPLDAQQNQLIGFPIPGIAPTQTNSVLQVFIPPQMSDNQVGIFQPSDQNHHMEDFLVFGASSSGLNCTEQRNSDVNVSQNIALPTLEHPESYLADDELKIFEAMGATVQDGQLMVLKREQEFKALLHNDQPMDQKPEQAMGPTLQDDQLIVQQPEHAIEGLMQEDQPMVQQSEQAIKVLVQEDQRMIQQPEQASYLFAQVEQQMVQQPEQVIKGFVEDQPAVQQHEQDMVLMQDHPLMARLLEQAIEYLEKVDHPMVQQQEHEIDVMMYDYTPKIQQLDQTTNALVQDNQPLVQELEQVPEDQSVVDRSKQIIEVLREEDQPITQQEEQDHRLIAEQVELAIKVHQEDQPIGRQQEEEIIGVSEEDQSIFQQPEQMNKVLMQDHQLMVQQPEQATEVLHQEDQPISRHPEQGIIYLVKEDKPMVQQQEHAIGGLMHQDTPNVQQLEQDEGADLDKGSHMDNAESLPFIKHFDDESNWDKPSSMAKEDTLDEKKAD